MGEFYNNQWRLPNNENKDKSSNYSMNFDSASSQYINAGDSDVFSFTNGSNDLPFTFSSWVYFDSTSGSRAILGKDNGTTQREYALFSTNNGTLKIFLKNLNTGTQCHRETDNAVFSTGQWYHVAVLYDGSGGSTAANGITLYIDGTVAASTAVNHGSYSHMSKTTADFNIGRYSGAFADFSGKIDHVAIFDYVLSSSQISDLYGNSTNGVGDPMSLSTKPVAYYKLGEKAAFNGSEYLVTNSASEVFSPYALDFDGSNDYIDCGNSQLLDLDSSFTISAWIFMTGVVGYDNVFTFKGASKSFALFITSANNYSPISFGILDYPTQTIKSTGNITFNEWNNITIVYNGNGISNASNFEFYINNSTQSLTNSPGFSDAGSVNYIGNYNTNYFSGSISNVSIWNTALTDGTGGTTNQISELYNSGKPSDLNTHSAASNLVSWWQLGANSSFNSQWTVLDEVGTNNGTSNGMAENDLVNGPGTTANGLSSGMGSGDNVIGEAPFSDGNSISYGMGVEARTDDTPS